MTVRVRLIPEVGQTCADALLAAALRQGVDATDVMASTGGTRDVLADLQRRRQLDWCVDGATARPLIAGLGIPEATGHSARLSRFAVVRRVDEDWVLESGRSAWQVRLDADALRGLADLTAADANDLQALLGIAGMLADHDEDEAAVGWEPHDRYFATRSRTDLPGVTGYRLEGVRPPEPARRTDPPDAPRISLPAPTGPRADEPTLWDATARRRSVREFSDAPVRIDDLGELLWRTLRVIEVRAVDADAPYERVLRPVPSGGAMHATDLWLVCTGVEGVPDGVWRYDPFAHELVGCGSTDDELLSLTMRVHGAGSAPVIGLITTRHARTSWKYGRIALALELKDVGVIMEALQLTAVALGLGMCPWGSGPVQAVADLLGVDPEIDMPVGEFVLGVPSGPATP